MNYGYPKFSTIFGYQKMIYGYPIYLFLYCIYPQMSITCRVPATCVKSKGVKTADRSNEFKAHSVSVYRKKIK